MNLISRLYRKIFPKNDLYLIEECEVPYHIFEVSKLYPLISTYETNTAKGEIRRFSFLGDEENKIRVGQGLLRHSDDSCREEIWIHLGQDFFKLIVKA